MPQDARGPRGRVAAVVFASFVCQLGLGYAYLFSPLLREVTEDLGWTRAEFAAARAVYFPVLAIASAFAGRLTVRVGARPILLASAVCLGATFWLMSGIQRPVELYLVNVLYGLFMAGLGDVVIGGVVTSWVERWRGAALGFAYAASNLGGMLLVPVFAALSDAMGWREALRWLAGAGTIAILPFAYLAGRRAPVRQEGSEEVAGGLASALRTRSFWALGFALLLFFAYFVSVNDAFFSIMMDAGMSRVEAGAWYSTAIGMGWLAKLGMGVVADFVPPKAGLALDCALLAASALFLLLVPDQPWLWAFVVSYGLAVAARDVVYPLVVGFSFGMRTMPEVYGALMLSLAIGGSVGSFLTQLVHDLSGSYRPALVAYAVLNLLVLASLALVRREQPAGVEVP
ncbi:MAG: MFS transporter [Proteobacteria bacterium]|nr:MFS transporter [Pseudomonadota bacterium]